MRFPGPTHLVLGIQQRKEAERFLEQLRGRMADYGLELHSDKTRLIQFGRFAAEDQKRDGAGKPETFDFLGFTHICGTTWKNGKLTVKRQTVGKRMRVKLQSIRAELRRRMHEPIEQTGKLAETGGPWVLQLSRGTGESAEALHLPRGNHAALVGHVTAAQSTEPLDVGANRDP